MGRFQVQATVLVVTMLATLLGALSAEGNYYGRRYLGAANGNKNKMVFPDDKERYKVISKDFKREANQCEGGCFNDDIPLEIALKFGNITSEEDLLQLVDPDTIDPRIFSKDGFGERSGGEKPVPAGCNTQPTIVSLRPDNNTDPRLFYQPSCTRVARCSGCCVSNRFSCQPTSTRTRTFTVMVLEYKNGKVGFRSRDLALIEEHVGCACLCRVKEEHCSVLQRYDKNSCRCECVNNDDRAKCLQQQDIKQWNPETCLCECTVEKQCSSGSYFDQNYCRCIQNYTGNRYQNQTKLDRRRLILKPVSSAIIPPAS